MYSKNIFWQGKYEKKEHLTTLDDQKRNMDYLCKQIQQ